MACVRMRMELSIRGFDSACQYIKRMKKIITYGTFDLLHQGHLNLLRRAKALGDFLVVGVTNDSFDRERGKLNVHQDVLTRVEAVRATGLADKIIIENYVGQKMDDINEYGIDAFAIGSDWEGKFDYLSDFCEVVYLPRTQGVSSTQLREASQSIVRLGIVGAGRIAHRMVKEVSYVSGVRVCAVADISADRSREFAELFHIPVYCTDVEHMYHHVDAVYIATPHLSHSSYIRGALEHGKHVLCETPLVLNADEARELFTLAEENKLVLMEANKTAHCPAFNHLVSLIRSGLIGDVVDVEASLSKLLEDRTLREFCSEQAGGSVYELGSYPLLPILRLLGINYKNVSLYSRMENGVDVYTKGVVLYEKAFCSFKLGLGIKTEGNLIISGTKGYAYVPAPWWKTDFFELRYENQNDNKKFFYKWDGDGLRYELHDFVHCIFCGRHGSSRLTKQESITMAAIMQQFTAKQNCYEI